MSETMILTVMAKNEDPRITATVNRWLLDNEYASTGSKILPVIRGSKVQRYIWQSQICNVVNPEYAKLSINKIRNELNADLNLQTPEQRQEDYRLAVFDMDSTLIECEGMDKLAQIAGVGQRVVKITQAAMRGEIDFAASFAQRLSLLAGLPDTAIEQVLSSLTLSEGAAVLIGSLRAKGIKTVILSGGFDVFAARVSEELGMDAYFANTLTRAKGILTGEVETPIIDANYKAKLLRCLCRKMKIRESQVIAVGDGANDLPMLRLAGLGVAFRAKPLVQAETQYILNEIGLDGVLYLMGMASEKF